MQCCRRASCAIKASSRFTQPSNFRTFFGQLRQKRQEKTVVVDEENTFFQLSSSPIPELRARAQRIKRICRCPICVSQANDSDAKVNGQLERKPLEFECSNCGYPTHCSKEHWEKDSEHIKYCNKLREVNEDDHDLKGPREKTEYYLPGTHNVPSLSLLSLNFQSAIRIQELSLTKKPFPFPIGICFGTRVDSDQWIQNGCGGMPVNF